MTTFLGNQSMNLQAPTDQQIAETYEQLGLNDPAVREFYENLRDLASKKEAPTWLRTSHHSSAPRE